MLSQQAEAAEAATASRLTAKTSDGFFSPADRVMANANMNICKRQQPQSASQTSASWPLTCGVKEPQVLLPIVLCIIMHSP